MILKGDIVVVKNDLMTVGCTKGIAHGMIKLINHIQIVMNTKLNQNAIITNSNFVWDSENLRGYTSKIE